MLFKINNRSRVSYAEARGDTMLGRLFLPFIVVEIAFRMASGVGLPTAWGNYLCNGSLKGQSILTCPHDVGFKKETKRLFGNFIRTK